MTGEESLLLEERIMGNILFLFNVNFVWLWIYHGVEYIGKRGMDCITMY